MNDTALENIAVMRVYKGSDLVSVIPNVPGKDNSLRIFHTYAIGDSITHDAVNPMLAEFVKLKATLVTEAEATPGLHPNIDLPLRMQPNDKFRVEYVTTKLPNVLRDLRAGKATKDQAEEAMDLLNDGKMRLAEKVFDYSGKAQWQSQLHGREAMSAYFSFGEMRMIGEHACDKVPLKFAGWTAEDYIRAGIRVVPGSVIRKGAYVGRGTTIMNLVNVGAYVSGGESLIDGGARVATGAQLGFGVKIGGGSAVEGVLAPSGRMPTILEDNVEIGAQCEVSGIIGRNCFIGNGTVMASGKKIWDERTNEWLKPALMDIGGKPVAVPVIPEDRVIVGGVHMPKDSEFGSLIIRLLKKSATEVRAEMPEKNPDLYSTVLRAN